jgi:hypothetical protein
MSRTRLFIIGAFIICILILLWLFALKPSSELSEDKFVEIYVELSIAKEMFAPDTVKLEEEKERIFEQAEVTQDNINDFISRCNQKPDRWAEVWKKIVEKLEERRGELK